MLRSMTDIQRLDDCLSVRDGRLWIEECDAVELVRKFGSPLFVFSEDQVRRNVRRFREAFARGWPDGPVKVMPAAKANWITAIQRILASEGCGCDIYSAGELAVALRVGFDPQFISVNGVPKDDEHIRHAIEVGARLTIDAADEVERIERLAGSLGKKAQVRLRLKPILSGFIESSDFVAEGLVPTDIAAIAYKGGLAFDEIREVVPALRAAKNLELTGFHQHHGRHHRSTRYWEQQMTAYAEEIARVCDLLGGYRPKEIDIGGGFAIPRDPHNAVTDYTAPAQLGALYALSHALQPLGPRRRYAALAPLIDTVTSAPNQCHAPSIEAYAEACTRTLRQELERRGIPTSGVMLQLEPGRSIHGDSGVHLATVRAIKRVAAPIRWKIVAIDTTEFWLVGGRYEYHLHDFRVANKADAPATEKIDVVGRSCYGDRLMPTIRAPEMQVGDIFAFLDTGAYQEVSCANFNAMPRPAALLVTGANAAIIRRKETEEDVFRRDELPAHLKRQ